MAEINTWGGRSLSFVRQVVGQRPRYMSAAEAMKASEPLLLGPPPVGAFVWYSTSHPHGNVALGVGYGLVLAIGSTGHPLVCPHDRYSLGEYQGWTRQIGPKEET